MKTDAVHSKEFIHKMEDEPKTDESKLITNLKLRFLCPAHLNCKKMKMPQHFKQYYHACSDGVLCENNDTEHLNNFSHPCPFGLHCTKIVDPLHSLQYTHHFSDIIYFHNEKEEQFNPVEETIVDLSEQQEKFLTSFQNLEIRNVNKGKKEIEEIFNKFVQSTSASRQNININIVIFGVQGSGSSSVLNLLMHLLFGKNGGTIQQIAITGKNNYIPTTTRLTKYNCSDHPRNNNKKLKELSFWDTPGINEENYENNEFTKILSGFEQAASSTSESKIDQKMHSVIIVLTHQVVYQQMVIKKIERLIVASKVTGLQTPIITLNFADLLDEYVANTNDLLNSKMVRAAIDKIHKATEIPCDNIITLVANRGNDIFINDQAALILKKALTNSILYWKENMYSTSYKI